MGHESIAPEQTLWATWVDEEDCATTSADIDIQWHTGFVLP
jgi:hypothetical protein